MFNICCSISLLPEEQNFKIFMQYVQLKKENVGVGICVAIIFIPPNFLQKYFQLISERRGVFSCLLCFGISIFGISVLPLLNRK